MPRWLRVGSWLARGQAGRLVPALVGLGLGVFLLVFFVALGEGIRRNVVRPVFGALTDEVHVTPSEERVRPGVTMEPMETFTAAELERMASLEGVRAVFPEASSRFDVVLRLSVSNPLGGLLGPKEFVEETKAFLSGLPDGLVRDDIRLTAGRLDSGAADPEVPVPFTWSPGQEDVPLLLSPLVATLWNTAYAESFNLPRVSRDEWVGRELEMVLGWNHRLRGVVAGFSPRVDVVAAPVELVEHFNRLLTPDRPRDPGRVHVKVEDSRHLATVVARIEEEGWHVTDEGQTGRRVSRGLRIAEAALAMVGLVFVVVSLVNLSTVLLLGLRERRYELAVLRAYGAGRGLIAGGLALQTTLVGLAGATLGLVLAHFGAVLVDAALVPLLEPALGRIGTVFHLAPRWLILVLLGAPLAALAATLQPVLAAGRANLADVLRR